MTNVKPLVVFAGLPKVLRRLRGTRKIWEVAAGAGLVKENLALLEYRPAQRYGSRMLPERLGQMPRLDTLDCLLRYYEIPLSELELLLEEARREVEAPSTPGEQTAEEERPSIAHLDLSVYSEETERALYELVVADNFRATKLDPPDDVWVPPYTPEAAHLEVKYLLGRWIATWWRLELATDLPEADRRETLILEDDPDRPGTLFYREV
ncbi:MAG TPA: hypothetical protein VF173_19785 [Thermoanaerobaculia bacterium]|nr:hypothetical protein [Thermoanaerobaculia bacterium]